MNQLKRVLGLVWIALAMAAAYFCIFTFGLPKFMSGKQDDLVFGIIILYTYAVNRFIRHIWLLL
jgi:hypothetical protein